MLKVLLMHIVQFFKSDHLTPSGGRLNLSKNTEISSSDVETCGRRFLRNCMAKFNETMRNNYVEGVVDAHCSIFKIRSFSALLWKIELWQKYKYFSWYICMFSLSDESRWQHTTVSTVM